MNVTDHEVSMMNRLSDGVLRCWPHAVSLSSSEIAERFGALSDSSCAWILTTDDTALDRNVLVLITSVYAPVVMALVDRPTRIMFPHCDDEGILCLLRPTENMPLPVGIEHIEYLLSKASQLFSESGSGTNRIDYLDEITDYWRLFSSTKKRIVYISESIVNGTIYYASKRNGDILIGTSPDELRRWHENLYSHKLDTVRESRCFRIEEPLYPEQYPQHASDLGRLLSARQFAHEIDSRQLLGWLPVMFTFKHGDRDILLGAVIESSHTNQSIHLNGHRSTSLGLDILVKSYRKLSRVTVKRVDRFTLTSRTAGIRYRRFAHSNVVVVGCGSVGGIVATQLLQSGVGSITLIDHDHFDHQNTGRHVLHGKYIGVNKAEALKMQLGSMFPGSTIEFRPRSVQRVISTEYSILDNADLVISATGDWPSNYRMNLELVHQSHKAVLFGWTEAFAMAGHSFLSIPGCPCYCCVVNKHGCFDYNVFEDDGSGIQREDGCATMFQTFTASSVAPIASMIVRHALDYLDIVLDDKQMQQSELRSWTDTKDFTMSEGGIYTKSYTDQYSAPTTGGVQVRSFPNSRRDCEICLNRDRQ